jgi:threonine aldolase
MMSHVPTHITNAAFEGHMALTESLKTSLGREPSRAEAAQAMAEAYGDMLALFAGSGAQAHQVDAINRMAQRAYEVMLTKIMTSDCGGSA